MDAILKLRDKYKFKLTEDSWQREVHGAEFRNKKMGSFGNAAAFSFYVTKNMMAGEGRIILTGGTKAAGYKRQLINHSRYGHSTHAVLGYKLQIYKSCGGNSHSQV
jgi:dTDP-4-amino-4,6-dideoxygalactose transaminase